MRPTKEITKVLCNSCTKFCFNKFSITSEITDGRIVLAITPKVKVLIKLHQNLKAMYFISYVNVNTSLTHVQSFILICSVLLISEIAFETIVIQITPEVLNQLSICSTYC